MGRIGLDRALALDRVRRKADVAARDDDVENGRKSPVVACNKLDAAVGVNACVARLNHLVEKHPGLGLVGNERGARFAIPGVAVGGDELLQRLIALPVKVGDVLGADLDVPLNAFGIDDGLLDGAVNLEAIVGVDHARDRDV